jgi:hypothetical protein
MKTIIRSLAFVLIGAACAGAAAEDSIERAAVSFSDPSRPGEVAVRLVNGSISVKAGSGKEAIVEVFPHMPGERDPGEMSDKLRRLPQSASLSVEERNNRIEIGTRQPNIPIHLRIQVPARTNLTLSTVNSGDIDVAGVEGELELSNVNGSISLTDVAGSVVAHTVNGTVEATLTRATGGKPMAFTSLNGRIDVTLPAATKANLRLRTDNGRVMTDFELTGLPQPPIPVEDTDSPDGRFRIGKNKVVYGSINGGGADIELRTFNGNVVVRKGS